MSLAGDSIMHSVLTRRLLPSLVVLLLGSRAALALPSYARQTGQECAACHNGFPELTPYGRLFKLNGYTFGGGQSDLPPLAMMVVTSDTHTQVGQPGGAAPHYGPNNNFSWDAASLFYGGAITTNMGAFIQGTYDNVGRNFTWDNLDIRYAGTTRFLDKDTVLGVTLNNNPTVTDVWNSTPAWSFPFVSSGVAPTPQAGTLIEGGFAQQVIGSTTYGYWGNLVYAEFGAYSTLTKGVDSALGVPPAGTTAIKGLAPYWRLAIEPKWGANSFEVGTFGLAATLNPGRVTGFGTDHAVDIGVDTQYQYLAELNSVSLQASFITENQTLTASQAIGNTTNGRDHLQSLHIKSTYYYDQTYGGTVGYFNIKGNGDPLLYGAASASNSPNSAGWIAEADYLPFNHGGPSFWPWLNMKIGLQYVLYTEFNGGTTNFDGAGRNGHDNNTLFAFAWFAF
jgi:hypothetical protein